MGRDDDGPISQYNSLTDPNLQGYYSKSIIRHHLRQNGLINRRGEIIPQDVWRKKILTKERMEQASRMVANKIVQQAIEIKNLERAEIRRKLEEIAKKELVKKIRGESLHNRQLPLLWSTKEERPSSELGRRIRSRSISPKNEDYYVRLVDDNEYNEHRLFRRSNKSKSKKNKSRRYHSAQRLRPLSLAPKPGPILITMVYFGKGIKLPFDTKIFDSKDEITIYQQHCGGENLLVYSGLHEEGDKFRFESKRHKEYPFSLTIYINGTYDFRVSTCCEYRHQLNLRLGGKTGRFAITSVTGHHPCPKCLMEKTSTSPKRKDPVKKEEYEEEFDIYTEKLDKNDDDKRDPTEVPVNHGSGEDEYGNDFDDVSTSNDKKNQEWLIKVYTSDLKRKSMEGTDARVYISLIGSKDESERIRLNKSVVKSDNKDLFEKGNVDEFLIKIDTFIGKLEKIRIGHDNSGFGPGWHLNKVELINMNDRALYVFLCNRWLSKDEDDEKIERILYLEEIDENHPRLEIEIKHESESEPEPEPEPVEEKPSSPVEKSRRIAASDLISSFKEERTSSRSSFSNSQRSVKSSSTTSAKKKLVASESEKDESESSSNESEKRIAQKASSLKTSGRSESAQSSISNQSKKEKVSIRKESVSSKEEVKKEENESDEETANRYSNQNVENLINEYVPSPRKSSSRKTSSSSSENAISKSSIHSGRSSKNAEKIEETAQKQIIRERTESKESLKNLPKLESRASSKASINSKDSKKEKIKIEKANSEEKKSKSKILDTSNEESEDSLTDRGKKAESRRSSTKSNSNENVESLTKKDNEKETLLKKELSSDEINNLREEKKEAKDELVNLSRPASISKSPLKEPSDSNLPEPSLRTASRSAKDSKASLAEKAQLEKSSDSRPASNASRAGDSASRLNKSSRGSANATPALVEEASQPLVEDSDLVQSKEEAKDELVNLSRPASISKSPLKEPSDSNLPEPSLRTASRSAKDSKASLAEKAQLEKSSDSRPASNASRAGDSASRLNKSSRGSANATPALVEEASQPLVEDSDLVQSKEEAKDELVNLSRPASISKSPLKEPSDSNLPEPSLRTASRSAKDSKASLAEKAQLEKSSDSRPASNASRAGDSASRLNKSSRGSANATPALVEEASQPLVEDSDLVQSKEDAKDELVNLSRPASISKSPLKEPSDSNLPEPSLRTASRSAKDSKASLAEKAQLEKSSDSRPASNASRAGDSASRLNKSSRGSANATPALVEEASQPLVEDSDLVQSKEEAKDELVNLSRPASISKSPLKEPSDSNLPEPSLRTASRSAKDSKASLAEKAQLEKSSDSRPASNASRAGDSASRLNKSSRGSANATPALVEEASQPLVEDSDLVQSKEDAKDELVNLSRPASISKSPLKEPSDSNLPEPSLRTASRSAKDSKASLAEKAQLEKSSDSRPASNASRAGDSASRLNKSSRGSANATPALVEEASQPLVEDSDLVQSKEEAKDELVNLSRPASISKSPLKEPSDSNLPEPSLRTASRSAKDSKASLAEKAQLEKSSDSRPASNASRAGDSASRLNKSSRGSANATPALVEEASQPLVEDSDLVQSKEDAKDELVNLSRPASISKSPLKEPSDSNLPEPSLRTASRSAKDSKASLAEKAQLEKSSDSRPASNASRAGDSASRLNKSSRGSANATPALVEEASQPLVEDSDLVQSKEEAKDELVNLSRPASISKSPLKEPSDSNLPEPSLRTASRSAKDSKASLAEKAQLEKSSDSRPASNASRAGDSASRLNKSSRGSANATPALVEEASQPLVEDSDLVQSKEDAKDELVNLSRPASISKSPLKEPSDSNLPESSLRTASRSAKDSKASLAEKAQLEKSSDSRPASNASIPKSKILF